MKTVRKTVRKTIRSHIDETGADDAVASPSVRSEKLEQLTAAIRGDNPQALVDVVARQAAGRRLRLTVDDAAWIMDGVLEAERAHLLVADYLSVCGLVAVTLYDLTEKGKSWHRGLFRSWLHAAVSIRLPYTEDIKADRRVINSAWELQP